MYFYNKVFASSFQLYSKYYQIQSAVYSSIMIVVVHFFGGLFLLAGVVHKLFKLDFSLLHSVAWVLGLLLLFIIVYMFIRYYTKERTELIIENYRRKNIINKRIWGLITLFTLITEYVLAALLFTNPH